MLCKENWGGAVHGCGARKGEGGIGTIIEEGLLYNSVQVAWEGIDRRAKLSTEEKSRRFCKRERSPNGGNLRKRLRPEAGLRRNRG